MWQSGYFRRAWSIAAKGLQNATIRVRTVQCACRYFAIRSSQMPSVSESKDGLTDSYRPLLTVFWITTAIFLFLIAFMFTQDWIPNAEKFSTFVFLPGISVLCILGIALMVLAALAKIMKGLKNAFLIVGTSSIGMPVSIVLHNVLYAAIRAGFGNDILQKLGGN